MLHIAVNKACGAAHWFEMITVTSHMCGVNYVPILFVFVVCYWQITVMLLLQVLTLKQFALLNVHSYPYLIQMDHMLGALARQQNEPSQRQILASAHTVDTKPHWALLHEYLSGLRQNEDHIHEYVPFLNRVTSQNSSGSDGSTLLSGEQARS